ncbi:hypothetical protein [Sphingomonas sp. 10B4]|uniref:hypothetical protein n=1 Tax=Sphingomonas sp. 10B4 TaxID=3048575 RepID=UPI002AB4C75C|nr:hypothetical protein [Sphingomonas sp. 10B4]MDY7524262.1 hypothetical protein [Sphingomonas sp. 10B4]MEB0283800.1 hypothetical protein [Sphingomonas sp. 10B4]
MPLTLTPIDHDDLCHGWRWEIADEADLARKVAMIALGQYRHVAQILADIDKKPAPTRKDTAAAAIERFKVSANGDPWHRDGWIFQTISWIAAHRSEKGIVARAPHAIPAHKGFDGMQLRLDKKRKAVTAVVIFEDKATDSPRKTVREDVWDGIRALEAGERMPELIQETTTILEAHQVHFPDLDIYDAIETILWDEVRNYRVSITTSDTHVKDDSRRKLFKGFDGVAPGKAARRRADTMHIPELRDWMDAFALNVITQIKAWRDDV